MRYVICDCIVSDHRRAKTFGAGGAHYELGAITISKVIRYKQFFYNFNIL